MHPLLLVLILLIAGVAILCGIALARGWLRLASAPAEAKFQFLLMRTKEPVRSVETSAAQPPDEAKSQVQEGKLATVSQPKNEGQDCPDCPPTCLP